MTTPTTTPALRSALTKAVNDYLLLTNAMGVSAENIMSIIWPHLAPAPVEQAALAAAKEIDYTTPWETPRAEHWARIITRHFQSLATEKPTSSPGETGGEDADQRKYPLTAPKVPEDAFPAQSQTPMTDAEAAKVKEVPVRIGANGVAFMEVEVVPSWLARQLETALAAAKDKLDSYERMLKAQEEVSRGLNTRLAALQQDHGITQDTLTRVIGERDALQQQVGEDTRRLDWLEEHGHVAAKYQHLPPASDHTGPTFWKINWTEGNEKTLTLRAAIDLCLARQPDQRQGEGV